MSSRRKFIGSGITLAGLSALPSLVPGQAVNDKKRNIICVGGHPDDPESGCGGTLALLSSLGHDVSVIYLTKGEAGIPGKTHMQAAEIRVHEALEACKILNVKASFAGQTDGETVVSNEAVSSLKKRLTIEKPDIVLTHWPLDRHKDHQCASILTIQCWLQLRFDLYFFEVCTGEQTLSFQPTDYVDITAVRDIKKKAVFCHTSQDPEAIYECGHAAMEEFRGREIGVKAAEGFIRMFPKSNGITG